MKDTPNTILLTIDALRADHCSWLGYERETTPHLEAFGESNIEFHECISVSSHTREAMPSLLSGYYPSHFAANGFYAGDDPLLAERLSNAGYATGGFHSNPYLSRAYGFDRGFDMFYDDLLLGRNRFFALAQRALEKYVFKRGEYYARADEINRRSLNWLDSIDRDQPVFLWNHYMDVHGPYHAPQRRWADKSLSASEAESLYRRSWKDPEGISDREQRLLIDSYDDEIRWLDSQIHTLLTELRDRNLLESSFVIITADHGDAFGENGYYTHPRYLHEALLHVPLIMSPPGKSAKKTITTSVSTIDVAPTILERSNLSGNLPGESLMNYSNLPRQEETQTVFASATGENEHEGIRRYAVRSDRWKAVLERDIESGEILTEWVYDLQDDPREQEALSPDQADAESLINQLRDFISSQSTGQERERRETEEEQSAEIDERLEALGYK